MEENIECAGFTFYNNFDSANLAKVEKVEINKAENGKNENNKSHKNSTLEVPSHEFNLWTKQDCHGTEFQNNNRTWFHFGVKAAVPGVYVKLNLVNLNKQVKMFSQGMCPVFKVIPGHPQWDRIKEKPTFMADDKNSEFMLSFNYRASENLNAITYFAFTYPFSYTDLQNYLKKIDAKMSKQNTHLADDIYYHRECAIKSLEGRRLDILTISSYYNKSVEREAKIKDLFPEENEERPFKFYDKKIIFLSARVHPGETPSSFVLNGFINLLLNRDDQIAIVLRRLYVFKLIPMLNPDGVAQGYYRMDTKGVNLNRLYLNPSKTEHPTIFAAKQLLRYYHNWYSLPEESLVPDVPDTNSIGTSTFDLTSNINNSISNETNKLLQRVTLMSLEEKNKRIEQGSRVRNYLVQASEKSIEKNQGFMGYQPNSIDSEEDIPCRKICSATSIKQYSQIAEDSGIFLYLDFHGHASKKGIFMYGNHFDDPEDASACMLLPKLMSINNSNFHFTSCNFAEKNMYLIDKRDGMSREGSGRVAVYKLFGLVHSYTLECNYNTGRLVNSVPARQKENIHKLHGQIFVPPKYNPTVFEEVGAAFGPSILDMTGNNPNSRLPNSQYRSLKGLKSYLKLISTNHYQTTLNKPLHKTDRYSQDSSSSEILDKPTTTACRNDISSTSCRKYYRASTGFVKTKIKRNHHHQVNKQLPNKITNTTSTRSVPNKFSTANKNNKLVNKPKNSNKFSKSQQLPTKMKIPVKNNIKKSTIYAKRITIKKHQVGQKSKVRHKIHIEFQQASKKNTHHTKFINNLQQNKPKNKTNYFTKIKKNNVKIIEQHKKVKKSSISKI